MEHCVAFAADEKGEEKDLDEVLGSIQSLHSQLQVLTVSQHTVEAYVKKIYQEIGSQDAAAEGGQPRGSAWAARCGLSAAAAREGAAALGAPTGEPESANRSLLPSATGHAGQNGSRSSQDAARVYNSALDCHAADGGSGGQRGALQHHHHHHHPGRVHGSARHSSRRLVPHREFHAQREGEHTGAPRGHPNGMAHRRHCSDDFADVDNRQSTGVRKMRRSTDAGLGSQERAFWPRKELAELKRACYGAAKSMTKDMDATVRASFERSKNSVFPLHPDAWPRALFDFVSVLVLLYDSVMIPYTSAFFLPFNGWLAVVSWLTAVFWVVDMMLGFVTGFYQEEVVVMRLGRIGRKYLRTGFFPNLFLVTADIGSIIFEELGGSVSSESQRQLKTLLRLLRFIKLERIPKLSARFRQGKIAQAFDAVNTVMREKGLHEQFNLIIRVCKLVFIILWVNHVICCLWHSLGSSAIEKWINDYSIGALAENDDAFSYMAGLYWTAIILISGGSMMVPTNIVELVMTVFCVVFGFIFTSVLISSLLSTVIEFQEANKDRQHKLTTLRQFLYQNKVKATTAAPIVKQARERLARRKRLHEGDVDALAVLSPALHSELWYSIYGPHLAAHLYLNALRAIDGGIVKSICQSALAHGVHPPSEILFEAEEEARGAFYVCHGSLEYRLIKTTWESAIGGESSFISVDMEGPQVVEEITGVEKRAWISEVALWGHWIHRGWLEANTSCELLTIDAENFVKVVASFPRLISAVQCYSSCMLAALEQEPIEELSDLVVPVAHSSVVALLPLNIRRKFSEGAVSVMLKQRISHHGDNTKNEEDVEELREEYDNGKCDVMLDASDMVHRVLSIVGVRLHRWHDGLVLARVGEIRGDKMIASCEPPNVRVNAGEYPREALERLLESELRPVAAHTKLGGHGKEELDDRASKRHHGFGTTYARTLFEAEFDEGCMDEHYMRVLQRVRATGNSVPSQKSLLQMRRSVASNHSTASKGATGSGFSSKLRGFAGGIVKTNSSLPSGTAFDRTLDYDAFVFRSLLAEKPSDGGALLVYAWVLPEDLDFFSSDAGVEALEPWMAELQPPKEGEEEDEAEREGAGGHRRSFSMEASRIHWAAELEESRDGAEEEEEEEKEEEEEDGELEELQLSQTAEGIPVAPLAFGTVSASGLHR